MGEAHVIRLRGPWESTQVHAAQVRWRRRFGRPTGLGPGATVSLHVHAARGVAALRLNGEALDVRGDHNASQRCDVTERLLERNEIEFDAAQGDSFEVWLEIVERKR